MTIPSAGQGLPALAPLPEEELLPEDGVRTGHSARISPDRVDRVGAGRLTGVTSEAEPKGVRPEESHWVTHSSLEE